MFNAPKPLHRLAITVVSASVLAASAASAQISPPSDASGATTRAAPGITTAQIITQTQAALPSCLAYRVTGVCFFLKCTGPYCTLDATLRVSHYMPDDVVSTYPAPEQHPWLDLGKPFSMAFKSPGDALMGALTDSQADTGAQPPEHNNMTLFKSADAIGNPLAAFLGGNTNFAFPDPTQLALFSTVELPRISQMWASVPSQLVTQAGVNVTSLLNSAASWAGQVQALSTQFSSALSGLGSQASATASSAAGSMFSQTQMQNVNNTLDSIMGNASGQTSASGTAGTGNAGANALICPGGAGLFTINFNSDLDSRFWRGVFPLEQLYPGSWIPGIGEVGNGLVNTWGGTYPRIGMLTQAQPVKASAVIAARVASIIEKPAQPHIYKQLTGQGSSYIYFGVALDPRWQMLYPAASSNCITFGSNDSLSPTPMGTFGYGQSSANNSYAWNLWHRYECCHRPDGEIYLFSVP